MSLSILPVFARIYIVVLVFLAGLFLGSGLNCLSYRYAHGLKWSGGRSVCTSCGHVLSPLDLIPLFSWLFLKGKCRYCGEKISARYPISELILSVCYVALLYRYGLTLEGLVCAVLISCLFCLSFIDIDTLTIPNRFLIIPAICRIAFLLYDGGIGSLWFGVRHALILGGGIFVLVIVMDKVLKKESMGGGDIKLLFLLGLFFDIPCSLLLLITACIVGLVIAVCMMKLDRETPFPFGPSISIAAFITLLIGESLTGWYIGLF